MDLVRSALSHNELATRVYAYAQDGVLALLSCLDCADAYGTCLLYTSDAADDSWLV